MSPEEIIAKIETLKAIRGHLRDVIYQVDATSINEAAPSGTYEDELNVSIYLKSLRINCVQAIREINNTIEKLTIQAKLNPLTEHRVQDGDTLEHLSLKYYGNPHDWPKIMAKNKTGLDLVSGQVLIIPQ